MTGTDTPLDSYARWANFQHFQGAYLLVVIQYWAGNAKAKSRAMECRFSDIVKVGTRSSQ